MKLNAKVMNTLRNKVQLIGNLGQDPEIRSFDNGKVCARFSLATTDAYRDADGNKVTETQWHNIVAWGNLAKTIEKYLVRGSEVAVEGKLTHRSYDDKEGNKRYYTEVVMNDMVMLRGRNGEKTEDEFILLIKVALFLFAGDEKKSKGLPPDFKWQGNQIRKALHLIHVHRSAELVDKMTLDEILIDHGSPARAELQLNLKTGFQ